MRKYLCCLLWLVAPLALVAQAGNGAVPRTPASQTDTVQPNKPDPGVSLTAQVYGETPGDSLHQNELVRYFLLSNVRKDLALVLDSPTAFPLIGPVPVPSLQLTTHEGKPIAGLQIPPGRKLLLKVTTTVPHPGTYTGNLQLAYHYTNKKDSTTYEGLLDVTLTAKRSASVLRKGKPFFKVEPIGILVQSGGCTTQVRFVIRDTSGKGGQMQIPLLLLNQSRGDTSLQAHYRAYTLAEERRDSVLPLHAATLDFAPNEAKRIRATYTQLPLAEQYAGRVVLQGDSFYAQSQPFSIRLSRTIYFAVLVITLGLLLAALSRWLYGVLSPRLRQRLALLGIKADFQVIPQDFDDLNANEMITLQRILGFVDDLLDKVGDPTLSDVILATRLSNFKARRTLFYKVIDLRQALDTAGEPTNPLYAAVQATHVDFLRVRTKSDAELEEQTLLIEKAGAQLRSQLVTKLKAGVVMIQQTIKDNTGILSVADEERLYNVGDRLLAKLKENVIMMQQTIKDNTGVLSDTDQERLNEIGDSLATPEGKDLTIIVKQYDSYVLETGRCLCKGLQRILEGAAFPSEAWEPREWDQLRSTVQVHLKSGLDTNDSLQAIKSYLNAFAAFRTAMDAQLKKRQFFNPVTPNYTNASALAAYKVAEPFRRENNPMRGANSIRDNMKASFTTSQVADSIRTGHPMKGTLPDTNQAKAHTGWLLFFSELIYAVIVLSLSLIIGLQMLYIGDDTWGSLQDILVAFTWGFGIHAITRNTDLGKNVFAYVSGKINNSPPPPTT